MTIYFSKSTNFFYDTAIFPLEKIPSDKVELTYDQWQSLLNSQSEGKTISSDENGMPIAVPQSTFTTIESARLVRDKLLIETDWTQANDLPQTTRDLWVQYRQALRDVPQQVGFPANIQWPSKPI